MEKNRLVKFVAKIMEESGFKVYENFQTSRHIIDIYGVLPTVLGDIGVVVAIKNYDERWEVGLDVLKEMEMVAKTLKASKIVIVSTSYFTDSAMNYGARRNIKLIDKDGMLNLAKKFSKTVEGEEEPESEVDVAEEEYVPSPRSSGGFSLFKKGKTTLNRSGGGAVRVNRSYGPLLKAIFSNTIVLIVIVVLLSSLVTYLVSLNSKSTALNGITTILSSAILSYGLSFVSERNITALLVKGTTIFFVSLIIYVIIIIYT